MPRIRLPILRNFADSKCAWGYITLCSRCESLAPRHVDLSKAIAGFPLMPACELCGVRSE